MPSNIDKMYDCIEYIENVNPDNIEVDEDYELFVKYLRKNGMSERDIKYVISQLEREGIVLYYSPFVGSGTYDVPITTNIKILIGAFIDMYCGWADREGDYVEEAFESVVRIPSGKYAYAVDYTYWYGAQSLHGHSFVSWIIGLDNEKQAEELRERDFKIFYDVSEVEEELEDDLIYLNRLGEGNWGTPIPRYCSYDEWVRYMRGEYPC